MKHFQLGSFPLSPHEAADRGTDPLGAQVQAATGAPLHHPPRGALVPPLPDPPAAYSTWRSAGGVQGLQGLRRSAWGLQGSVGCL